MTTFQATLVNLGYGQLALRDDLGKIAQKWTLAQPKCVIGSAANCNVRCMLPGIADHHLLLVVGVKQLFVRALATGVQREGRPVNELLLTGDQVEFSFAIAGHHFQYTRQAHSTPVSKSFVQETQAPPTSAFQPQSKPSAAKGTERLKFTFVKALAKNRVQQDMARSSQEPPTSTERPNWVEEIVRDALRPVESRLDNLTTPIQNLERRLRRDRIRARKAKLARKENREAAHALGDPHTQQLAEAQEAIQKIVTDQTARLDLVNQHVVDIVSQLAALQRVVSNENGQHEAVERTHTSGEEILRLQHEMLALVSALQSRAAEPVTPNQDDAQWRASVQRQLDELHQSLAALDDIKASLQIAADQNRELTQDLESHWQTLEEVARRPVIIQAPPAAPPTSAPTPMPMPIPVPLENLQSWAGFASSQTSASTSQPATSSLDAAAAYPHPFVSPVLTSDDVASLLPGATVLDDAGASVAAHAFEEYVSPASLPAADTASQSEFSELDTATSTQASGSSEPQALPSWWSEDPVESAEAHSDGENAGSNYAYAGEFDPAQPECDSTRLYDDAMPSAPVRPAEQDVVNYFQNNYFQGIPEELSKGSAAEDEVSNDYRAALSDSAPDYSAGESPYAGDDHNSDAAPDEYSLSAFSSEQLAIEPASADESLSDIVPDFAYGQSNHEPAQPPNGFEAAGTTPSGYDHSDYGQPEYTDETHSDGGFNLADNYSSETEYETIGPTESNSYVDDTRSATEVGRDFLSTEHSPESQSQVSHQPAASQSGSEETGDESVEDYMRRLLARMRGVSETEVTLPGLDPAPVRSPEPSPRMPAELEKSTASSSLTEPMSESWTEPFDPEKYVPRGAPERNRDLNALRELANTSARSHIQVSARRRHGTAILIKSSVAMVGLIAGIALVSINGARINIAFIATITSFMVALIWGYDALATLRPLIQASRHPKPREVSLEVVDTESEST